MGKLGRFACILTPMLCTLLSLILTMIILVGGTNKSSAPVSNVYFFLIDTRYIQTPSSLSLLDSTTLDDALLKTGLNSTTASEWGLKDFYTSSLWNYCGGTVSNGTWTIDECGTPSANYSFDPVTIIESSGTHSVEFPTSVKNIIKAIHVTSRVMIACYLIGFMATALTFVIGWFGLLSRWGSCVTTIIADIAFFFLLTASIIATAIYVALRTAFNKVLEDFAVKAYINNNTLAIAWAGVGFALAASVFWMLSTCCCSGRTSRVMNARAPAEPRGYQRVASPYEGSASVPMTHVQGGKAAGFEPYRHA
ncbi:hypothetical protein RUND412_007814 [Rhizina undulata]